MQDEEIEEHSCDASECWTECVCGRGSYPSCRYRSCYHCFLDRRAEYQTCIYCGRWHSPEFDTCFKCRPETRGRDDAAKALRTLILWRDGFACRYCGAVEGDMHYDPRAIRPRCRPGCMIEHIHREEDSDGMVRTVLHVDHIVPCAAGGKAVEWNLQTLCSRCNIAKGATWYRGCRHDQAKTKLCQLYRLMAGHYFNDTTRAEFMADWEAFEATGTWDPIAHQDWRRWDAEAEKAGERP